jgi:hypothetical protein
MGAACSGARAQLAWSAATIFGAGVLVGDSAVLLHESDDTRAGVSCIVSGIGDLAALSSSVPVCSSACDEHPFCACVDLGAASTAADAFPSLAVDIAKGVVAHWTAGVLGPAVANAAFAAPAAALCLAVWCGAGLLASVLARLSNAVSFIALVATASVFASAAVVGLSAQVPLAKTMYDSYVAQPCTDVASEVDAAVSGAEANVYALPCAPPPPGLEAVCGDVAAQVEFARNVSAVFTDTCACVSSLLGNAETAGVVGAAGLVAVVASFATATALCCSLGCFGAPGVRRAAARDPATAPLVQ